MKTQVLFTIYLLLCFGIVAESFGQTVIAWRNQAGMTGSEPSSTTHALLESGVLSRGSAMIYSNNSTFTYTGVFPISNNSRVTAINSNAYYQIALQIKPGAILSLSGLTVKLRKANAATANKYCWRYSIDGGAYFHDLGPEEIDAPIIPEGTNNGIVQDPINLSGVSNLQGISSTTSIIFRLYAWGGTSEAAGANLGFGKSSVAPNNCIVFTGVVTQPIAQTPILTWRPPSAIEDALPATETDINIDEAELSRGSGITFNDNSTYTYTSIFPNGTASKAAANMAGTYYKVVMKAKDGYYLNIDGLTSRIRRSSAGAVNSYRWAYSLNGTDFTDVGSGDVTLTMTAADDTNGEDQYYIDLSGIEELHNVPSTTTVTFRFSAWGATGINTNAGFGKSYGNSTNYNSLVFYGSVLNTTPVKLKSFQGKSESKSIKLNWVTSSEQNNDRFEVLRVDTDKNATVIGTVKGNGTSNGTQHYSFVDYSPVKGTNYYQLRQVDYDGRAELSEVIAVVNGFDANKMVVRAKEDGIVMRIENSLKGRANLKITDVSGKQLVFTSILFDGAKVEFDIPFKAPNGVYVVSLILPNAKVHHVKFNK